MEDKVFCPWCGSEMRGVFGYSSLNGYYGTGFYKCDMCKAIGPLIVGMETKEEAIRLATTFTQRRFTPLIKPLTLAEARRRNNSGEPLYVESNPSDPKGNLPPVNDWIVHFKWLQSSIAPDAEPYDYIEEGYGVSYRCWERKPTEEERKAATWEY